jgi:hypothetical protein
MPQVVWADRLTLPPDSTGKATGMVPVAVTGGTLYLPASVMVDATGNTIDSATAAPAGTERGLITRNIPSGTQPVSLAAIPTVTEKQDQTANVATTWTSATALNTTTATYAVTGYGTANVALRVPTTTTAGAVTIEVSQDGTDWVPAGAVRQDNSYAENPVPLAYFPGTNGTRVYALSIDAFTLIRVKLTTAIVGAGNVVVTISAVAGGIEPVVATRARKVASYSAFYRTATRPYKLGPSMTANTRKQVATIHHAATATKTVRIRRAMFCIYANTVAGEANIDLVRITTAPATGNPAITPGVLDSSDVAAEATCLALPTTAATEAALIGSQYVSLGATGAAATTNPPPIGQWMDLYQPAPDDDEMKQPTIRAGVLEGWAIVLDHTATSPVSMGAWIEFTEEAP